MITSFENIWAEFYIPLKSFIQHRVCYDQDVEDILQIVFLKIFNHINNLNEADKIHAWIYAVTRNAIFDFYREHKQHPYTTNLSEDLPCETQIEETYNFEIAQCLKGMIQHLPEKYKQALILTEFQNLTQKELAIYLGLSVSGAKSRVQRARVLLKEILLNCCSLEIDCRGNIIDYKAKNKDCKC